MSLTAHEVILRPVISEKSMDESQRGKYTFAVHDDANKLQIKRVNALEMDEAPRSEGELSAVQRFETDFTLMVGNHSAMLDDLLQALDGR